MRIKMLCGVGGVEKDGRDFSIQAGAETERFSDKEAIAYIESGQAVPVCKVVERSVKSAPETRAKPVAPAKPKRSLANRIKSAVTGN